MNNNLLYTVEDKPPFGLSLLLAAQHLLAALGGITVSYTHLIRLNVEKRRIYH